MVGAKSAEEDDVGVEAAAGVDADADGEADGGCSAAFVFRMTCLAGFAAESVEGAVDEIDVAEADAEGDVTSGGGEAAGAGDFDDGVNGCGDGDLDVLATDAMRASSPSESAFPATATVFAVKTGDPPSAL